MPATRRTLAAPAARQCVVPDRPAPRVVGVRGQRDHLGQCARGDPRVPAPRPADIARLLAGDGLGDAVAHRGGRLTGPVAGLGRVHFEAQVEAVEQRRRQPAAVPRALRLGAFAARPAATARARVRARDEEEVGREHDRHRLARDAHDVLLDRLAQRVERVRWELAQLVEEQHPAVCQRHLAGAESARAAADERGRRRGVMRRAERASARQTVPRSMTGGRVDARDLERLVGVEGRQDGRQPAGEHRLSGARRAGEQHVMPARGRDLQRAPCAGARARRRGRRARRRGRPASESPAADGGGPAIRASPFRQARSSTTERAGRTSHPVHERRLGDVGRRHDHRARPGGASESTSARTPGTGRTDPSSPSSPSTPTSSSTPSGSSPVAAMSPSATASSNPAPVLRTPPGREVDRDPLLRELEMRRQQRRPHPLARLTDRGVRQAYDVIAGQAGRHVDLDGHDVTVDAGERGAANRGEHGGPPEDVVEGGP